MTEDHDERERVWRILHQLPERDYALHALGSGLMQSLRLAGIRATPEDAAFAREVACRIYEAAPPERREQYARWLQPGGVLRLWSE